MRKLTTAERRARRRRRYHPTRLERLADWWLWTTQRRSLKTAAAPLLICGVGGSGTRALVNALAELGVYAGSDLSPSRDSRRVGPIVRRWGTTVLSHQLNGTALPADKKRELLRQLELACIRHRDGIASANQSWLIKNPRAWILAAQFAHIFPDLTLIHMVRDGRDMAFSSNQGQLEAYGEHVLDDDVVDEDAPLPVRSMHYWAAVNQSIARTMQPLLGDRYVCVRFEALCQHPAATIERIATSAGVATANVAQAARRIKPPDSIGRWQEQPAALIEPVLQAGHVALRQFGYENS